MVDLAGTRVLHYLQRWLPLSERFIEDVVKRTTPRPVIAVSNGFENRALFPARPAYRLDWLFHMGPPPLRRRAATFALLAIAARRGVGLVHVHMGYRVHDVLGLVRRRKLPLVLSLHGHDVTAFVREYPRHYDGIFDAVAAVIVPSQFLAERVRALGADDSHIHVIPTGVDTTECVPTPLPGNSQVLFAGRFVAKKGLDVLARAWPKVVSQVPHARLHVAGYGPLEDVARGVADQLTLHPAHSDVLTAIGQARVVVTPSHTDGNGDAESLLLVNLEAQACGRPVVTTRHGGIPEFVEEGRSALLVSEDDPGALAAALIEVLTDEGRAEALAARGPVVAARFDVRVAAQSIDQLYASLLHG